ncbi:MAG: hypothetical protein F6J97_26520 [Leptolyngbya sp. SIO4C1]|nr:hypothetical protein [Leptolyngbya sp. SIO4C1]
MNSIKGIASAVGLAILGTAGFQTVAQAQMMEAAQPEVQAEMPSAAQPGTSAAELSAEPIELAQRRRRRGTAQASPNFIGGGINIGIGDEEDSVIGDTSFAVISKFSVADNIALRPSVLIGDDVSFMLPVTYNFPNYSVDVSRFSVIPYVGGGIAVGTEGDADIEGLISAGADVPLSRRVTANGQANVGIGDEVGFSILLGVGYNFDAF